MNTTKSKIRKKILSEPNFDRIWSVEDFNNLPRINVLKAFSDLVKEKIIKRAKRGFYYRTKVTVLGETSFSPVSLALSNVKNKCDFCCISGVAGFNELGFTTQIPNNIVIACNCNFRSHDNVRYIYRNKPVSGGAAERIVLDAIIDIKTIPDTTVENTVNKIKDLIKTKKVNLVSLVKTAFNESPRVKSVIGAIAQEFNFDKKILERLKNSVNPLTMIYLNTGNSLAYADNWQIRTKR